MERRMIKRSKWQYPQVGLPAPRILQLPRRQSVRRSSAKGKTTTTPSSSSSYSTQKDQRVKLEALFHQERSFDRGGGPVLMEEGRRREKVAEGREIVGSLTSSNEVDEAKWRFQTEMLRSECNLLRIEKEIALKKMERRKKRMEKTLRSAVHTLLSVSPILIGLYVVFVSVSVLSLKLFVGLIHIIGETENLRREER